ncbi:TBC1 domain family member 2B-like isoform X1 [Acipenser oxyrinchus oxyrinchus]|uniref:TBC1 domain family member 2B-like isoform X1 n=1 Tax=Acipenser oxyrinchus oxyrinchus TaxID=40147 RepID=A0AAD8CYY1_ACIOX|nr:TBC1 domain family member 2B-like isoform X1 [Acipenser oxyrinchus oxyrinchus]
MHGGDGSEVSSARNSRVTTVRSLDVTDNESTKDQPPKLCGFLNKLAGKGPLRGFKTRWFVYDPRKCYLYYFKTPQDSLPLGHIEIADACFSYEVDAGDEGQFEIHTSGNDFILKAPNRQVMRYWLQQLQQKRWEFCNARGAARDSWNSPTLPDLPTGLVAKDTDAFSYEKPSDSTESVRNEFAMEIAPEGLVGVSAARNPAAQPSTINFSLKQWGTELRNSVSHLRAGRGSSENRRSVFYTSSEEWEMIDPTSKDFQDLATQEYTRKSQLEANRVPLGSAFTFDFSRNSSRPKRPFLRDMIGPSKNRSSNEASPVEWSVSNGNKSESQLKIQSLQEELTRLKEEHTSQKELVRLLQQTLRGSQYDKRSSSIQPGGAPDGMEVVREKDQQIQALSAHIEKLGLEKESLHQEVKSLKNKVGELNEQLGMLMETIQAKDEVIIKNSSSHTEEASTPSKDLQELDRLKDSLQGYTTQNKFLNKEILELTVLRRNAVAREKALEAKCTGLEAKLCQIESKYLVLLQEVKNPVCSGEQGPAREVISRLLEDALEVETPEHPEHTVLKPHAVSEFDVFGFKTMPEDDEEEQLVAKVRALDLKSLSFTDQEVSVGVKWENYLASTMNREMVRTPELKGLIRSGIPHEHRSKVWKWCVCFHVKKFRDSVPPDYFNQLLQEALEKQNPASKQIELDLLRTLPNNKHYASPTSEGIQKLRNILLAFSWRNPDIGYCQGLNRLAAVALLYLDQEDAFWCLVAIVEVFMPRDYYTKTLLGSQVDQRVFKDLMSEKLPRLHVHFEQYKVDFSLITFNWFLVVFVDSVVSDILFKIWDSFLYEGPKIIFRFALALFKYKEEEMLKLQDSMAIFKYLRYFTHTILDARKLMSIAFGGMNPFPLRQIQNRRTFHLEKVRLELTELEAIRQNFLRQRDTSLEGRGLISDDEEDND